jgi:hypothetical protein
MTDGRGEISHIAAEASRQLSPNAKMDAACCIVPTFAPSESHSHRKSMLLSLLTAVHSEPERVTHALQVRCSIGTTSTSAFDQPSQLAKEASGVSSRQCDLVNHPRIQSPIMPGEGRWETEGMRKNDLARSGWDNPPRIGCRHLWPHHGVWRSNVDLVSQAEIGDSDCEVCIVISE